MDAAEDSVKSETEINMTYIFIKKKNGSNATFVRSPSSTNIILRHTYNESIKKVRLIMYDFSYKN